MGPGKVPRWQCGGFNHLSEFGGQGEDSLQAWLTRQASSLGAQGDSRKQRREEPTSYGHVESDAQTTLKCREQIKIWRTPTRLQLHKGCMQNKKQPPRFFSIKQPIQVRCKEALHSSLIRPNEPKTQKCRFFHQAGRPGGPVVPSNAA